LEVGPGDEANEENDTKKYDNQPISRFVKLNTVWREISVGIYFCGFRGSEKIIH
jgi:hypothetical protein